MLRKLLIYFILASFITIPVWAQNQCQDDIDKANKLYEEGIFKEAEQLVKKTLETCELNESQEKVLLKLMASIYYEMDELELADEYVAKFLKKEPYYVPSKKNDPFQFRQAIKKVKSWPRFSAGIRIGIPVGFVTTKKIYPVLDTADYSQDYALKPVFIANAEFAWNITDFLAVNLGAGIRIQKLLHQVPQYNQLFFNYEEQFITSNFPLTFQFTIPMSGSFAPVLYVGGEFEYFTSGKYNYYYTGSADISNDLSFYLNRKRENVSIQSEQRNLYRYAALGGIRLLYRFEKLSIYADCRYIKEFSLYNVSDKRYENTDLFLGNNYILSDIEMENIDISIGILYNFSYKVKSKY